MSGNICNDCGAPMKTYDLYDRDTWQKTGEHTVCPNAWKQAHA